MASKIIIYRSQFFAAAVLLLCGLPFVASIGCPVMGAVPDRPGNDGVCVCPKGTAYDFFKTRCMKCPAPRFTVGKDGRCYCGKGYAGRTLFASPNAPATSECTKCPAGFTTAVAPSQGNACVCADKRKGALQDPKTSAWSECVCRWGFKARGGSCGYTALCATNKQAQLDFWFADQTPQGWTGARFPSSVPRTNWPGFSTKVYIGKDGSIAWPVEFKSRWNPKAGNSNRVAVRISTCACVTHADWDSQFAYTVKAANLTEGAVYVVIDGGKRERRRGDYYDQNVDYRPGKTPVLPVTSSTLTKAGSTTVKAPQYKDRQGGFLSGMDAIPNIKNYEACHRVEVFYSTPGRNLASFKLLLPK